MRCDAMAMAEDESTTLPFVVVVVVHDRGKLVPALNYRLWNN